MLTLQLLIKLCRVSQQQSDQQAYNVFANRIVRETWGIHNLEDLHSLILATLHYEMRQDYLARRLGQSRAGWQESLLLWEWGQCQREQGHLASGYALCSIAVSVLEDWIEAFDFGILFLPQTETEQVKQEYWQKIAHMRQQLATMDCQAC